MTIQSNSFAAFLFSFKGRITRGQWWCLQAITMALLVVVFQIGEFIVGLADANVELLDDTSGVALDVILLEIIAVWIDLSATAKRFHDRGKSGWNCLWQLFSTYGKISIFNFFLVYTWLLILGPVIYVLYECGITENGRETNKYGPPAVKSGK